MPPKQKALEEALAATVRDIWHSDQRDALSVNFVRTRVEENLELDEGFFKSAKWKSKSKDIITIAVNEMLALDAEAKPESSSPAQPKSEPKGPKNGVKRESDEEAVSPAKKRQKVESPSPPPKKTVKKSESDLSDLSSELSDLSDLSASEEDVKPSKKTKSTKPAVKRKAKKEKSPKKVKKVKRPKKGKKAIESDEESDVPKKEESEEEKKETKEVKPVAKVESSPEEKLKVAKEESVQETIEKAEESDEDSPLSDLKDSPSEDEKKLIVKRDDSDSEMSIVFNEPPKAKKKGRGKAAAAPKAAKGSKGTKASTGKKTAEDLSPDEAEIKKLQGQLLKCGIRKIWAFELKQYGDNSRAKLRHLRGMLKEIGMDGRFSETKAREVKEQRELMADLEAVQEMDRNWGVSGRASRSRAAGANKKSFKEESDDGDEKKEVGQGDDEDSDAEVKPFAKAGRRSARADLAFLGDESESD